LAEVRAERSVKRLSQAQSPIQALPQDDQREVAELVGDHFSILVPDGIPNLAAAINRLIDCLEPVA
jgi:hypothetical protein